MHSFIIVDSSISLSYDKSKVVIFKVLLHTVGMVTACLIWRAICSIAVVSSWPNTHIYTHLHTSTHIYTHLHTSTYIYTHLHTSTHIYTHLHIYTSTHTHTHTRARAHTHTHTHARTHTHTHTNTHTHTHIHTHLYLLHLWSQAVIFQSNLDKRFLQAASSCTSVICSRVTPLQKVGLLM